MKYICVYLVYSDVKNTNANIVTLLVKSPTSVQVTADVQPGDTGVQKGTVRSADGSGILRFDVVKTSIDPAIRIDGAWNAYYIFATNSSIAPGNLNNTTILNNAVVVLTGTTQSINRNRIRDNLLSQNR